MGTKIVLISLLLHLLHFQIHAQSGCTDAQAINFDPIATVNDGSCEYNSTNYSPSLIQNLPASLTENSGMIVWNNVIWFINDSGSLPKLIKSDLSGNVFDTVFIENATNVDWEAITQSETSIYIGDIGNNAGNRHHLCVYQIEKQELLSSGINAHVPAQKRVFTYGDQINFNLPINGHSFDAEALYYEQDSLVLLSKNWNDLYTKRYRFPASWSDTLTIFPMDSMYVDGLITDVCIDSLTRRVVALGYKNNGSNFYTSFVYLYFDYLGSKPFSGNKRRIELGNMLTLSQTEGIALIDSVGGFISSEKISSIITIEPKLFSFDVGSFFSGAADLNNIERNRTVFYPNPIEDVIFISADFLGSNLKLMDVQGNELLNISSLQSLELNVNQLNPGVYLFILNEKCYRFIKK